jgi:hypothetical protein
MNYRTKHPWWYGIRLQVNVVPQCRNTLQYVVSYVKFLEDFAQTKYCSSNEKKIIPIFVEYETFSISSKSHHSIAPLLSKIVWRNICGPESCQFASVCIQTCVNMHFCNIVLFHKCRYWVLATQCIILYKNCAIFSSNEQTC